MPLSLSERLWNWRHRRIPDAQIREYTRVEFDADRERDGKATRVWIDEATIVEQRAEIEQLQARLKRIAALENAMEPYETTYYTLTRFLRSAFAIARGDEEGEQ